MMSNIKTNREVTETAFLSACGEHLIDPMIALESTAVLHAIEDDSLNDLQEAFENEF